MLDLGSPVSRVRRQPDGRADQALSLAQALMTNGDLLLLDQLTAGVDLALTDRMWNSWPMCTPRTRRY